MFDELRIYRSIRVRSALILEEFQMEEHGQMEHDFLPESDKARLKRLEFAVAVQMEALAKQKREIAELNRCCAQVANWGKQEVLWTIEVTNLLRAVDWDQLKNQFPGGGGTNPPQTPPDWPV